MKKKAQLIRRRPKVTRTIAGFLSTAAAVFVLGVSPTAQTGAQHPPHDGFYWLGEQNKASVIMLTEKGIITKELGKKIAISVTQVIATQPSPGRGERATTWSSRPT